MTTTAERIYEAARQLPEGLAAEALHYIEYLRLRAADEYSLQDLTRAQGMSMDHVWNNPADEVWNDVPAR